MPYVKLPINQTLYKTDDDTGLSNISPERHDSYIDDFGSMVRRPGNRPFTEVGSGPINGIFYWRYIDKCFVVSGKDIYLMDSGGNSKLLSAGLLDNNTRAIFDEALNPSRKVFITNGEIPVESEGITANKLTSSNAPQKATHLAIFDTYLIANQTGTQKIEYSVVGQPTVFNAEFAVAETQSDDLVYVGVGWDEIVAIGRKTQEFFYDDGIVPFVTKPGAMIEQGCIAPYSIKMADNSYFLLNHERQLIKITGRQPYIMSSPIDRFLTGLTTITDAIADTLTIGGRSFYILTFPTDNKTIVFDYSKNEWCGEWGEWDSNLNTYNRFIANYITYVPDWNLHLVGDYRSGKIYKSDINYYKDDQNTIRTAWITGNIDHGSSTWKKSIRLRIRVRRGIGDINSTAPTLMVRWRDNGDKTWKNTININLGKIGDSEFYKEIGPLGRYRSRQYEISFTDDYPLNLVSVEENVIGAENA